MDYLDYDYALVIFNQAVRQRQVQESMAQQSRRRRRPLVKEKDPERGLYYL